MNRTWFSNKFIVLLLLYWVIALPGCDSKGGMAVETDDPNPEAGSYEVPEGFNDGLRVGHAADVGMNVDPLVQMIENLEDGTYTNMHSVLIAKNDQLVFERYLAGQPIYGGYTYWRRTVPHNLHSVTKSFTSALIGIAIQEGHLSLDDRVIDFFPEYTDVQPENGREDITIRHALTMSTGLRWDESTYSYDDPRNDHAMMYANGDWVHYVLTRPMASQPGSTFLYNSGISITLGAIILKATGRSVSQFADERLFNKMGVSGERWSLAANGTAQTGGGLSMTPRDMLRFGSLFLNDGTWNDTRLINSDWANESTSQNGPNPSYGYHWWLTNYQVGAKRVDAYYAGGRGGQYIIVIDELDMVVVFTAGNDNRLAWEQPRDLLLRYILPSAL